MKKLKIKSMKPIGIQPVMDMSVPKTRNFVLDNGVVAHNCAYASLGHITMHLKHHYPLEWWASELNLSNEDKLRKYMGVIGNLVKPPNLKNPSNEWQIIDDKIVAPLTSVKGVGEKPVKTLMVNGPYESFEEFINTNDGRTFHIGTFSACLKARATDCFLNPDLPYIEAKKELVAKFFTARGKNPKDLAQKMGANKLKQAQQKQKAYDPIFEESDPFKLFLLERSVSKIFSKSLMDDEMVCHWLENNLSALTKTNRASFPYVMGIDATLVFKNVSVLEKLLAKEPDISNLMYGVLLFQGSSAHSGVSKKNGRPWKKIEVELSDGFRTIYCTMWDKDKPLRWNVDTPVLVYGRPVLDWRGRSAIALSEINRIQDLSFRSKK
jgi:hypothetical protein